MFQSFVYTAVCTGLLAGTFVSGYYIETSDNGPVVRGATVQFKVEVFDNDGGLASGKFVYNWKDRKFPERNATFSSSSPINVWNLTCNSQYAPGHYTVQITVAVMYRRLFIPFTTYLNKTIDFEVTKMLNGYLSLSQGNFSRKQFIDNVVPLNHSITIKESDMQYVKDTKNYIRSFWFVDCIYNGPRSSLQFDFNYTKPESKHLVQALVIASNTDMNFMLTSPLVTNGTGAKNNTGNHTEVDEFDPDRPFKEWLMSYNKTHLKRNDTFNYSGDCINISDIPLTDQYAYGLFKTNFTVKEPVKVAPINGTNWLKDGEILNITMSCTGSSPFKYCMSIYPGLYNVTGKEVCEEERSINNCTFNIHHLFRQSTEYTIVVFISNSVSKVIKPIAVNIYKVKKHPQLSVIIVPVAFSMVAVILVIFGVAYHVQSKRSCTVEVADFDFANQSSDMEYKTFRERLRESVSNLFLKSNDFNDDDDEQVWSPTRKYGSMQ